VAIDNFLFITTKDVVAIDSFNRRATTSCRDIIATTSCRHHVVAMMSRRIHHKKKVKKKKKKVLSQRHLAVKYGTSFKNSLFLPRIQLANVRSCQFGGR
jgi:hypothetical protein